MMDHKHNKGTVEELGITYQYSDKGPSKGKLGCLESVPETRIRSISGYLRIEDDDKTWVKYNLTWHKSHLCPLAHP
jgi:hypothetical protein